MTLHEVILPASSSIFFGSQYVPQKKLGEVNTLHYNLSMAIGIFFAASIGFTIFFLVELPSLHWIPIAIAVFSGIIFCMGNRLSISGVNRIGMSKATMLFNVSSVFSFIFGVMLYSEPVSTLKIIGMPIIICGSAIVAGITSEEKKKLNWAGIVTALGAALVFSIFNTLVNESLSSHSNPRIPFYALSFFLSIGSLIGNLVFINTPKKMRTWLENPRKFHSLALSGGIIWTCGNFICLSAFAAYGMSFTVPIAQTVLLIVSALWGILYFKEIRQHRSLMLFLLGAVISIIGIVIFSL